MNSKMNSKNSEKETGADVLPEVARYYSEKVLRHGPVPAGVDWNSHDGQFLRFEQLCKILPSNGHRISILDYGCGYGALHDYLMTRDFSFDYIGFDVSLDMIESARARIRREDATFHASPLDLDPADFAVASGIFNVKLGFDAPSWEDYVFNELDRLNDLGKRGFAFNMLTSYSDPDRMKDNLYYANPGQIFDRCKTKYSRAIALLHDYPLYEFTILVRKDS